MDTRTILLDVGGTFVKCSDGRIVPINSDGSVKEISDALSIAVGDATNICVAIPGPFDYAEGIFQMKHKFAAVYGMHFTDLVATHLESCSFMHDVNAMLLGELKCGDGIGFRRVALVSLGTGLGFAMSVDGNVVQNEMGSPLHSIYQIPYKDGILEDYTSKRAFLRGYPDNLSVKDLSHMARSGDLTAKRRFADIGLILANALVPILNEHSIECLLFGGQISKSFDLMETSVLDSLASVSSLHKVVPVSNIDNATFNGLRYFVNTPSGFDSERL